MKTCPYGFDSKLYGHYVPCVLEEGHRGPHNFRALHEPAEQGRVVLPSSHPDSPLFVPYCLNEEDAASVSELRVLQRALVGSYDRITLANVILLIEKLTVLPVRIARPSRATRADEIHNYGESG